MKLIRKSLFATLVCAAVSSAGAQTLNWGSEAFSEIVDSRGEALDNAFVFELGAFQADFTPDESNAAEWIDHWLVFDRSEYNAAAGYFSSSVRMQPDGSSDSAYLTPGASGFQGLEAYLWIRNGDGVGASTEWFLARADEWVFPEAELCGCGGALPLSWSVSDLGESVPLYGSQGERQGQGERTVEGPFAIQTHGFPTAVPEPGTAMLAAAGLLAVVLRRRKR